MQIIQLGWLLFALSFSAFSQDFRNATEEEKKYLLTEELSKSIKAQQIQISKYMDNKMSQNIIINEYLKNIDSPEELAIVEDH